VQKQPYAFRKRMAPPRSARSDWSGQTMTPARASAPPMNWPLVAGASALTLFILAGLGMAAWALVQRPAPDQRQDVESASAPIDARVQKHDQRDRAKPRASLSLPNSASESLPEPGPVAPEPAVPTQPTVDPLLAASVAEPAPAEAPCETYGTTVNFFSSQTAAARQAARDKKLQFVLHISGNFEDSKFT
jgi:hypothetical protein